MVFLYMLVSTEQVDTVLSGVLTSAISHAKERVQEEVRGWGGGGGGTVVE